MISLRNRFLTSVALTVILGAASGYSQTSTGRLSGVIHDATGAAVPGATITITNASTNATQTVTGTKARIGYLTNPPRTFGITLRFNP